MKSHNKIMVGVDKIYQTDKEIKDKEGNSIIIQTAKEGEGAMVGDRNLAEYSKLCIGTILMGIGSFSKTERGLYRSMDDKVHNWDSYEHSDIRERLKVGTQVLFQHNLTDLDTVEINSKDMFPATPNLIHCTIDDGKLNPVGGYILLNKVDNVEEIEKISKTIIIEEGMINEHEWDKYHHNWGRLIKQSQPLKGDQMLKAKEDDLICFVQKYAQTIIFQKKEYWLIMPSDAQLIVKSENFSKIKF
tara:strand:- start:226 stop:960 length:735 start_codon:yes stop_codon:yes gene_type:complete